MKLANTLGISYRIELVPYQPQPPFMQVPRDLLTLVKKGKQSQYVPFVGVDTELMRVPQLLVQRKGLL